MKNLTLIAAILLTACGDYPKYTLANDEYVPDSNKVKASEWVIKCVSASSYHMSGGDYEDPEDVIAQAERTANRLFSVPSEGLDREDCHNCMKTFIPEAHLSADEREIFNSLKKKE